MLRLGLKDYLWIIRVKLKTLIIPFHAYRMHRDLTHIMGLIASSPVKNLTECEKKCLNTARESIHNIQSKVDWLRIDYVN